MNKVSVLLIVYTVLTGFNYQASADVIIDKGAAEFYFKVDGKRVEAKDANSAARSGKQVEKCSPQKGTFETKDGTNVATFKCKIVDLVISAKTGTDKWKAR